MYEFKDEMHEFKNEMYEFKDEMYKFSDEVNERFDRSTKEIAQEIQEVGNLLNLIKWKRKRQNLCLKLRKAKGKSPRKKNFFFGGLPLFN